MEKVSGKYITFHTYIVATVPGVHSNVFTQVIIEVPRNINRRIKHSWHRWLKEEVQAYSESLWEHR